MSEPIHLADAQATERVGASLAAELRGGMVVTLHGDLGAGKTTLVRGVLRALGWREPVKSPTYTLVEIYRFSSLYFYHFDFYRFNDPGEWETAGLADYFRDDATCMVEWPERVRGVLPPPDAAITLAHRASGAAGRDLSVNAQSPAGERCALAIRDAMRSIRPAD
jgi:tRNA threonylcarbamoyladenosine biosynthesis protein TsaE